jgi:DNA-binding beta-propeller fold protein YncE
VIDGATNATAVVGASGPIAVAVNPVTNKIYAANSGTANVTVIAEQQVQPIPLTTSIAPLPGDRTVERTPAFTFTASSSFSPAAPAVQGVYYQVDTWQGAWTPATGSANSFTGNTTPLALGMHILYAYAVDGQEARSSTQLYSALIGSMQAYPFNVVQAATTTSLSADTNSSSAGSPVTFTAQVAVSAPASGTPTGTVAFLDNGVTVPGGGSILLDVTGHADFQTSSLSIGSHAITAV